MTASFIVIAGEPRTFYGPFETADAAATWARTHLVNFAEHFHGQRIVGAWSIAPVNAVTRADEDDTTGSSEPDSAG